MEEQRRPFEDAGLTTTGVGARSARAIDVTDSILRAKTANPDVWMSTGHIGDTNLLLRAARDQGFAPIAIILPGVGDTHGTLGAPGAGFLGGVLLVCCACRDVNEAYGPGSDAYLAACRAACGRDPIAPQGTNADAGMKILYAAIKAAGSTDYAAMMEAARKIGKPMNTCDSGCGMKFDPNMQNMRALPVIAQLQSGKVTPVYPAPAVAGTAIVNLPRADGTARRSPSLSIS